MTGLYHLYVPKASSLHPHSHTSSEAQSSHVIERPSTYCSAVICFHHTLSFCHSRGQQSFSSVTRYQTGNTKTSQ